MAGSAPLRIFPDAGALDRAAEEIFSSLAADAVRVRGRFAVALAGGSTPRGLYARLAAAAGSPQAPRLPWERTHVFWSDERHVPPDHPDSNYGMVRRSLLEKVPVPAGNIHRIPAENPDPVRAAEAYERDLRSFFALAPGELPPFDLVLLGLGADGHTASLFPGSGGLREERRLVAAPRVESLGATRITLTPLAINGAGAVVFLVSGAAKAEALRAALESRGGPDRLPARAIRPASGSLLWLVDEAAASLLNRGR